jgi:hypothetical protein
MMRELKVILWLFIVLVIASLPILLYLISGLEKCPVVAPGNSACSSIEQNLAQLIFIYSIFYVAIAPIYALVLLFLLGLTVISFLLRKRQ